MTHANSTDHTDPTDPVEPPQDRSAPDALKSLRRFTFAALAIAVIAVVVAVVAWFYPRDTSPSFTDQQAQDAKTNICGAFNDVRQAVSVNTNLVNPIEGDPIGTLAVAANARLALSGGGAYLRERLATEPAAPADLTEAVTSMANTLEELSIGYLAGRDSLEEPLLNNLNSQLDRIGGLCG